MVDLSELVRMRPQPKDDDFGCDDIANGRLFWQCESYDEYRLHCTIEGVGPLFTREEFGNLRQPGSFTLDGLAEVSHKELGDSFVDPNWLKLDYNKESHEE